MNELRVKISMYKFRLLSVLNKFTELEESLPLFVLKLELTISCLSSIFRQACTLTCEQPLRAVDILHDATNVVVGGSKGDIHRYNIRSMAPCETFHAHNGPVNFLAISKTEKSVVTKVCYFSLSNVLASLIIYCALCSEATQSPIKRKGNLVKMKLSH